MVKAPFSERYFCLTKYEEKDDHSIRAYPKYKYDVTPSVKAHIVNWIRDVYDLFEDNKENLSEFAVRLIVRYNNLIDEIEEEIGKTGLKKIK